MAGDGDVPASLAAVLAGVDAAYYLVHALDSKDFERKDAQASTAFGQAAPKANVSQLVYLGGLGADGADLSAPLRPRRTSEHLPRPARLPLPALRGLGRSGPRRIGGLAPRLAGPSHAVPGPPRLGRRSGAL